MAPRYYYLLTSLPALPELGEAPSMDLIGFREKAAAEPGALPVIDAMLLEHDLTLREAALAGEVERPEAVVLTAGQVAGQEALPPYLTIEPSAPRRIAADATWEAYYRHVRHLASSQRCAFAARWVGFEVALRNALVAARAETLGLDGHEYRVAEDLADEDAPVEQAVSDWSAAENPLAALRALDRRRWAWIDRHARYFSFALDELAAYARKLVLAVRWHLLTRREDQDKAARVK